MHVSTWSRRAVLGAGALGALAACSSDPSSAPKPTPTTPIPKSPSASSTGKVDWGQLRRNVQGSLARPGGATYDQVRLLQNPRYDGERPLAVLSVASADDVATGIRFAQDSDLRVYNAFCGVLFGSLAALIAMYMIVRAYRAREPRLEPTAPTEPTVPVTDV